MMHPALNIDLFASQAKEPEANVLGLQGGAEAMGSSRLADGRTSANAAARIDVLQTVGATVSARCDQIPEALERILAEVLAFPPIVELDEPPAFLTAPRPEYLAAIERGWQ